MDAADSDKSIEYCSLWTRSVHGAFLNFSLFSWRGGGDADAEFWTLELTH